MQFTRNTLGKIISSIRKTRSLKNAASVHSGGIENASGADDDDDDRRWDSQW